MWILINRVGIYKEIKINRVGFWCEKVIREEVDGFGYDGDGGRFVV